MTQTTKKARQPILEYLKKDAHVEKDRRVIVFESALFTPHTETAIELCLLEKYFGVVHYVPLFLRLDLIETYINYNPEQYKNEAYSIIQRIADILPSDINTFIPKALTINKIPPLDQGNINDLMIENFPIGAYLLSTLKTVLKLNEPDLQNQDIYYYAKILYTMGYQSFYLSKKSIEKCKSNFAYICNGRFISQAASIYACKSLSVDYRIHERGPSNNKFGIYPESIHHPKVVQNNWKQFTKTTFQPNLSLSARHFFYTNIIGEERVYQQFSAKNLFPYVSSNDDCNYVAFFTSSEYEMLSYPRGLYDVGLGNQANALELVIEICKSLSKNLVIRMHPNQNQEDHKTMRFYNSLQGDRVKLILPDEKFDSYQILNNAECNIVYISTMGCESLYQFKPTILCGRAEYYDKDGYMTPTTAECLKRCIEKPAKPITRLPAEQFAYYAVEYGIKHYYYKSLDTSKGEILGKTIL